MKKRFKDRKDARRVDEVNGMNQIMFDIKPHRCDSDVFINQKMDVTKLAEYIKEKKENGEELTFFHAFVTAIGKTFYNRPKLNYFVANRHLYEHNDVVISFVAKVSFEDKAEEMMVMIPIEPEDTINEVRDLIKKKVSSFREAKEIKKEGANNVIDVLAKFPNPIRIPVVGLLKWMDKKDLLPESVRKDNLYYSSIIVSNLGAIHCGSIYHNITDFGECSSLATMGEIYTEEYFDKEGKKKTRKVCEFGVNIDERVADGFYFAKSLKMIQYIFDHPETLEEAANTKYDVELR